MTGRAIADVTPEFIGDFLRLLPGCYRVNGSLESVIPGVIRLVIESDAIEGTDNRLVLEINERPQGMSANVLIAKVVS